MKHVNNYYIFKKPFSQNQKGFVVMIHWHPGWLGSMFNIIVINILVKAYGENE